MALNARSKAVSMKIDSFQITSDKFRSVNLLKDVEFQTKW